MRKRTADSRFYGGKFYKRLFVVFMTLSVLFSVLFTFFLFYAASRLKSNEEVSYKTLAQNRYNLIDTALVVLIGGMDAFVKNPYLAEWADAENAGDYYGKAIVLYDYIKNISSQLGSLSYEIAVIGERYGAMTLSGLGSGPFSWYAENETSLTVRQINDVCASLPDSNTVAVYPVYGTGGQLRELYFMRKQQWKTQTTFVVFKVFADPMFVPAKNENFRIEGPHGVCIRARTGEENTARKKDGSVFRYDYSLHNLSWTLHVELRKRSGVGLLFFCISFVFSLLTFAAGAFVARRTARHLYHPLGEIISESLPEKEKKPAVDEFEILRGNSRKIELLSQELRKTLEENEALTSQKYNRGLLEGLVSENDTENSEPFFVALVLLTNESGGYERDRRPYIQLFADACASTDENLQYVQYGVKEFALIIGCERPDEAEKKLKNFLTKLRDSLDSASVKIQAALSDCVRGKKSLQNAFAQARSILEFRHTQPHASILTSSALTLFTPDLYDYSLETEKKLLEFLIGGSRQTAEYFDEIMQKNTKASSFSFAARQNLLYALCGTLMRALQELKSTPEKLYGKSIDWAALYTGKSDEKSFAELKNIAVCISDAVRKNTSASDTKILRLMNDYIYGNFQRDISLQDLSDEFNITPKYCSKLFARLNNDTFKNYLNTVRIEKAREMLSENPLIKIVELAGKVGFNSATSFIRGFNKYAGVSPKAYAERVLSTSLPERPDE